MRDVLQNIAAAQMTRFSQLISPLSWFIMILGMWSWWIIIFSPSIIEVIIAVIVDRLAHLPALAVLKRIEAKQSVEKIFLQEPLDVEAVRKMSVEEQKNLVWSMLNFPRQRSRIIIQLSVLKALPILILITFFWHGSMSVLTKFLMVVIGLFLTNIFFYGCLFAENHMLICRKLATIHDHVNLGQAFKHISIPYNRQEFERAENYTLGAIVIFMLALQGIVMAGTPESDPMNTSIFRVVLVGLLGFLLLARMIFLHRKFFRDGLEDIFARFQSFTPTQLPEAITLHTYPILTYFTQVFNGLTERLRSYERELSHWIFSKTEQSRFQGLGEIAGLVIHDLSAPLHVIDFCVRQIKEQPELARTEQYQRNLSINSERAMNLIQSIRSYLRQAPSADPTRYTDVHQDVVRILESQFLSRGFHKIQMDLDDSLKTYALSLSKPDLIHVVLNLYANAVENLLTNYIEKPRINVKFHATEVDESITVAITDNGTGLSENEFERLTAFSYLPVNEGHQKGLGLRLIRRLVERNGGQLRIHAQPSDTAGTCFLLKLKLMPICGDTYEAQ